jgi:hypothetical protein
MPLLPTTQPVGHETHEESATHWVSLAWQPEGEYVVTLGFWVEVHPSVPHEPNIGVLATQAWKMANADLLLFIVNVQVGLDPEHQALQVLKT